MLQSVFAHGISLNWLTLAILIPDPVMLLHVDKGIQVYSGKGAVR